MHRCHSVCQRPCVGQRLQRDAVHSRDGDDDGVLDGSRVDELARELGGCALVVSPDGEEHPHEGRHQNQDDPCSGSHFEPEHGEERLSAHEFPRRPRPARRQR